MTWKEDESAKFWLEEIKSPRTRRNYEIEFPRFLKFYGDKTPSEIIKERRENLMNEDPKERKHFEHVCLKFQTHLKEQGLKPSSVASYIRTVRSFFGAHQYHLKFKRGSLDIPKPDMTKHTWNNIEIRAVFGTLEEHRDKAILLILYHSGLAQADLSKMDIQSYPFYEQDEKSKEWRFTTKTEIYIEGFREKTKVFYQTCISRDALHEINLMLMLRHYPKAGALFVGTKGERILPRAIREALKPAAVIALEEKGKQFEPSDLRDSYEKSLEQADIHKEIRTRMMGWGRPGAIDNYSRASEKEIREAYTKTLHIMSINEHRREEEAPKELMEILEKQETKIVALERMLKSRTVKIDTSEGHILKLQEQLASQQQLINQLVKALEELGVKFPEGISA
jgi:site-specific recombinase XerC